MRQDGEALAHASPRLRAAPAVVRAAVGQAGAALRHAAPGLRGDRALLRAAVETSPKELQLAPPHLRWGLVRSGRAARELVRWCSGAVGGEGAGR